MTRPREAKATSATPQVRPLQPCAPSLWQSPQPSSPQPSSLPPWPCPPLPRLPPLPPRPPLPRLPRRPSIALVRLPVAVDAMQPAAPLSSASSSYTSPYTSSSSSWHSHAVARAPSLDRLHPIAGIASRGQRRADLVGALGCCCSRRARCWCARTGRTQRTNGRRDGRSSSNDIHLESKRGEGQGRVAWTSTAATLCPSPRPALSVAPPRCLSLALSPGLSLALSRLLDRDVHERARGAQRVGVCAGRSTGPGDHHRSRRQPLPDAARGPLCRLENSGYHAVAWA